MSSKPVQLVCLLCCLSAGCEDLGIQAATGRIQPDDGPAPAAEEAMPRFVPDASGLLGVTPESLRRYARHFGGKALIVNFWASFCGSCKRELPMLQRVHAELSDAGVGLLLVSADTPDDREKAVALLREAGLSLPSHYALSPIADFKAEVEPRWKGALPATLLLDDTGRVRFFWNGPVLDEEVRPVVQGLLRGEAIDGMRDFAAEPAGE